MASSCSLARSLSQITYYFWTYFKLFPKCDGTVSFSVPTGNACSVTSSH